MFEITGGEVLLIVTAMILSLLIHLTSLVRSAKVVGFIGCVCMVIAALLDFAVVGLGVLAVTLATVVAVQAFAQSARS